MRRGRIGPEAIGNPAALDMTEPPPPSLDHLRDMLLLWGELDAEHAEKLGVEIMLAYRDTLIAAVELLRASGKSAPPVSLHSD